MVRQTYIGVFLFAVFTLGCGGDSGDSSNSTDTATTGSQTTVGETTTQTSDASTTTEGPATDTETTEGLQCSASLLQGLSSASISQSSSDIIEGSCNPGGGGEALFRYEPDGPGWYTFYMYNDPEFDAAIYVRDANSSCGEQELGCDAMQSENIDHPFVRVELEESQTVLIAVESINDTTGEFSLTSTLSLAFAPYCAYAFGSISETFGYQNYLDERDRDENYGSCGGGNNADEAADFFAPMDGTYTFTMMSDFDSVFYAADGDCETELACRDEGGPGEPEVITLDLVEGEKVIFGIDGKGGGTGLFSIDVDIL